MTYNDPAPVLEITPLKLFNMGPGNKAHSDYGNLTSSAVS